MPFSVFINKIILVYCETDGDCESGEICEMHYLKCKVNIVQNPDCLPGVCKIKEQEPGINPYFAILLIYRNLVILSS